MLGVYRRSQTRSVEPRSGRGRKGQRCRVSIPRAPTDPKSSPSGFRCSRSSVAASLWTSSPPWLENRCCIDQLNPQPMAVCRSPPKRSLASEMPARFNMPLVMRPGPTESWHEMGPVLDNSAGNERMSTVERGGVKLTFKRFRIEMSKHGAACLRWSGRQWISQ